MKKSIILLSIITIMLFFVACNDKTPGLKINQKYIYEKYELEGAKGQTLDSMKPFIRLTDDNRFIFAYYMLSSYLPYGRYEIKNGYLILKTDDKRNEYVFKIQGETLKFDAKKSKMSTTILRDGAVFK